MAKLPAASKPRDLDLEKKGTEALLGLKVVDPAMGSGHFLVAVVNEITHWIIDLLREYSDAPLMKEIEEFRNSIIEIQRKNGIRLDEELLTDTVILKRMVMKRCVYGVDINPLAVELAKVSLWLDSFTIGTPLTFLDHHIRVGDSLIGLWTENVAGRVLEKTLERWLGDISIAGVDLVDNVVLPVDLTIDEVNQSQDAYVKFREKTRAKRILLDMYCVSIIDPVLGIKLPKVLDSIETALKDGKEKSKITSLIEETQKFADKLKFFHWELEFPDAFTKSKKGFDLIVMNPPWDAVKPEDDDFFSIYNAKYRRLKRQDKKKEAQKLLRQNAISKHYLNYRVLIEQKVAFYKNSKQYEKRGKGDLDLWKLFLERCLNLQHENGSLAVVVPSGLVTAEGGKELRQALFERRIRAMFEFENKKGIFPDIDSRTKFVLLVADRERPTPTFPAAFYLHDSAALQGKCEQEKIIEIETDFIKKASPQSFSIPEARSKAELDLIKKIYDKNPLLLSQKRDLTLCLVREDVTSSNSSGSGWQVIEGKNFHQFILDFEKPSIFLGSQEGLRRTGRNREFKAFNRQIHEVVRLAFRGVGSGTNVRTMIAVILPPNIFLANKATMVLPKLKGVLTLDENYYKLIAYTAGILNSMVFDFLLRKRICMNLNFFYIDETPFPDFKNEKISQGIIRLAGKLSSPDSRFDAFSRALAVEQGQLTMQDRIRSLAELNALVAKLYDLSREELQIILQSFESFEEDSELVKMKNVEWDDRLIRKLNGETRKLVLHYFDLLNSRQSGVKSI